MKTRISPESSAKRLLVGYGRVDVTPDYPVGIAGGAAKRISTGALDPLYLTCIALGQGEKTVLLITMDFVCAYGEFSEPLRLGISEATGIPREQIILNGTHTHSSVAARNEKGEGILRYRADLLNWAVSAAKEALADLAPARLWYGSRMTHRMVWMRHYKMADGTFAGANYGSFRSGIVGHAGEADPEMQLIRFVRSETGKQDVILMNFPSHATINQKSILLSADFPGPARETVAEKTGALVAYFIAGAGDQVPVSRVPEEQFSTDYRVYGAEVGRLAVEGLENLKEATDTELRWLRRVFTGKSNQTGLDRLEEARAVKAIWEQVGGRGTPEGKAAAKDHGFSSVYAVTALLNRVHLGETRSMELTVLSLGEVSLLFAPYEMFGISAMQIKEGSPYAMTFIVSCSQNHDGYLPSELGWQLQCYEAQITRFARGTAEQLAQEYVSLLKELREDSAP